MKFSFVLELFICCFLITPFIGAVLVVRKDKTTLVTGEIVELTCEISGYTLAEWKKGSSAALTTCTSATQTCSVTVSDRYTFSTTSNEITVRIDNLNRADDGTTWTCNDLVAPDTGNIVLDPILTQQSGIPTLTESSECQEITCESSCIAPFASSYGSFTWTYIPDGGTAQPLTNPSPTLSSSSDGCPSSEGKVKSTLTSINKPTGFKDNVKFQCVFSQNGFSSSWTATSNECFKAALTKSCFSQAGCTAGVVLGSIYGTSWLVAIVVNLVIYCMNQMLLAWNLCDGPMKRLWIWILLFIFLPYIPSVISIYLFRTNRPAKKPTSGMELEKNGPKRPLPQIQPKNPSDPEKGSPRKLPEPPNPEEGFQSNRLSPLESNKLSNITETQQANGEQEKSKKKKKKKKKPKNNQVSDEEKEKSS